MIATLATLAILIVAVLVFRHWHRVSYTLPPGYTLMYRQGSLFGFWVLCDPDGNVLGDEIIFAEIFPGGIARNLTRRANAHVKRGDI